MPIISGGGGTGGGGGGGTVTSVSSANNSITVASPTTTPALTVGSADKLFTNNPPVAAVALNSQKITGLANGAGAQDAAAFGQIPAALPPSGSAGGDLTGSTYPNPVVAANKITVAKLATAVTLDAIATANATAADVVMNSHKLTGVLDPTLAQDAATKNYVDTALNGLDWKAAARLATATALPANVYANGASGVGATLTGTGFGALAVDGKTVVVGDRILVKNEVAPANNGIYVVTVVGAVATLYVLTRAADYNQSAEIQAGDAVYVVDGTANVDTSWVMTTTGTITVGTTAVAFTQFGGNLVSSVFTRTGAVVATSGDYTISQVTNGPLDVAWSDLRAVHAGDDDFRAGAIAGQWSAFLASGSATWTEAGDSLSVIASGQTGTGAAAQLQTLNIAAGGYIECACRGLLGATAGGNEMFGLVLANGSTGAALSCWLGVYFGGTNGLPRLRFSTGTLGTMASANLALLAPSFSTPWTHLRLIWVSANTFAIRASCDGISWTTCGVANQSFTMTPTVAGVFASTAGGTDLTASFDYFRNNG